MQIFFIICFLLLSALMPKSLSASDESSKPKVGVGVILEKDGKVLLGKRKGPNGPGYYAPPGGHLEYGETVEECAFRETAEETGIRITSIQLGPWTQEMVGQKHFISLFAFAAEFEGEPQTLEPDKCEGWDWYSWDELPTPLYPSVISLIRTVGIEQLKTLTSNRLKMQSSLSQ